MHPQARPAPLAALLATLLLICAPAAADQATDTVYMGKVKTKRFWLLYISGEKNFFMTNKVYKKHRRLWPFLKKGKSRIHVVTRKRYVVKITLGWKTKTRKRSKIRITIRKLSKDDRIIIDGREYLFISASKRLLKASPRVGTSFEGEEEFLIDKIKTLEVAPDESGDTLELQMDELKTQGARVGDTVALFIGKKRAKKHTGAIQALTKKTCKLLEWGPRGWADSPRSFLRSQVSRVRYVRLSGKTFQRLDKGELQLKFSRFRRGAENRPLEFVVEVSHTAPGAVLMDLKIWIQLTETLNRKTPDADQVVKVPALFPGDVHKFTREAIHRRYLDGYLVAKKYKLVPFGDPKCKPYLVAAIDRGADLQTLGELYLGAGKSKDPVLLHFLLNRVLFPPAKGGENPEIHAQYARKGMLAGGDGIYKLLLNDIETKDSEVKLTVLSRGKLIQEGLPGTIEPLVYKKKLIAELSNLPGSLKGKVGAQLFELYLKRSDLGKEIERAFSKQGEVVMPQLFVIAIPEGKVADKERSARAQILIRSMGPDNIKFLVKELEARGVDTAKIAKARQKHGLSQAGKILDAALGLAKGWASGKKSASLNSTVSEAERLFKAGERGKAVEMLREVLKENPKHLKARSTMPTLLLPYAELQRKLGETGHAATLLQEAMTYSEAAKEPLGRLLLEALEDDLKGIVMRSRPHGAAEVVTVLPKGQGVEGEAQGEWVLVKHRKGQGYVRRPCLKQNGPRWMPVGDVTPEGVVATQVERIKKLAPALAGKADIKMGTWYANLAETLYKDGKYSEVGPLLEKAGELAPNDARLGLSTSAWFKANMLLLVGLLVVAGLGGGGFFIVWKRSRPSKETEGMDAASLKIDLFGGGFDDGPAGEATVEDSGAGGQGAAGEISFGAHSGDEAPAE